MTKPYKKKIISIDQKEQLYQKWIEKVSFDAKADVSGACIHFYTNQQQFAKPWKENWFEMPKEIRAHGKIFAIKTGKKNAQPLELYDPLSRTVFFFDCDYYGWIKSAALALTGDILEDNHYIFSIHGALLDVNGKGIAILGPPGAGKTTTSYGLLRYNGVKLISDDWHFFNFINGKTIGYDSEKNTYIRADIAKNWKEYQRFVKAARFDNRGRAVFDLREVIGSENVTTKTTIGTVILLRRGSSFPVIEAASTAKALEYLEGIGYGNPHMLQNGKWKRDVRRKAYTMLMDNADTYILNTTETPQQSLSRICKILGLEEKVKKF